MKETYDDGTYMIENENIVGRLYKSTTQNATLNLSLSALNNGTLPDLSLKNLTEPDQTFKEDHSVKGKMEPMNIYMSR